ncbi:MAG: type II toxin-antitoxin system RelE/ParE family toxin [Isosphaeraceae bacterium]
MPWEVILDDDFADWLRGLDAGPRQEILAGSDQLSRFGPNLGRPRVDTLKGSVYPNLKELRVQYAGEPWRILFAFDPRRRAILLVGGNKVGDEKGWYRENIPIAEHRYARHLDKLGRDESRPKPKRDGNAARRKKKR